MNHIEHISKYCNDAEVLDIYNKHRTRNHHKMVPVPVCKMEQ